MYWSPQTNALSTNSNLIFWRQRLLRRIFCLQLLVCLILQISLLKVSKNQNFSKPETNFQHDLHKESFQMLQVLDADFKEQLPTYYMSIDIIEARCNFFKYI